MAAVAESGLLADIGKIVVGLEEQIFRMAYPDFPDIGSAGHPIISAELCGKAGIAHTGPGCNVFNPEFFRIMAADVFGGGYKRLLF